MSAEAVVAVNIDYTNSRVYPVEAENGAKILIPNISRIQAFVVQTIGQAAAAGGERLEFSAEPVERQQLEP